MDLAELGDLLLIGLYTRTFKEHEAGLPIFVF